MDVLRLWVLNMLIQQVAVWRRAAQQRLHLSAQTRETQQQQVKIARESRGEQIFDLNFELSTLFR